MSAITELAIAAANVLTDLPNPDPTPIPGTEDGVNLILGWMKYGGLVTAILALFGLAAMFMVNNRRGEGGVEHVKLFVGILIGVLIIGSASFIVGALSGA